MILKTSDKDSILTLVKDLYIPPAESHKGNNGRVLIIGGSTLFHSASLWAAEVASHFADMVHYASTKENNAIFHELKAVFRNGIVVEQKDIPYYVEEDEAILIGPGMMRDQIQNDLEIRRYQDILKIEHEAVFTRELTKYLINTYPHKRFVIDAGALQMMDADWLKLLKETPIITPHQQEFERLYKCSITNLSVEEKAALVKQHAKEYKCVILLKAVVDIVSDGNEVIIIEGGNQGLTKGGSGDILAGLTVSLRTKNDPVTSAVVASYTEKLAADELEKTKGYWYNMNELIAQIPITFNGIVRNV